MLGFKKKNNNTEELLKVLDLIIPHQDERDFMKETLLKLTNDKDSAFENGKYRFGYMDSERSHLDKKSKNLDTYVFYDLITESYLQLTRKINNQDDLWSKISVLLINYDCNHLRPQLDFQIYDNNDVEYSIDNANSIFDTDDYVIYSLTIKSDSAIGLISRDSFNLIRELLKDTELMIKIKE